MAPGITYSEKYYDDKYEYRHVILPESLVRHMPITHLLTETEWRNIGVHQSPGWEHYMIHNPEPYILLFRRSRIRLDSESTSGPSTSGPSTSGPSTSGPDCNERGELVLASSKSEDA